MLKSIQQNAHTANISVLTRIDVKAWFLFLSIETHRKKMAISNPGRMLSQEPSYGDIPLLDLQLSEVKEYKFLLLKSSSSLWYVTMAWQPSKLDLTTLSKVF